MPEEEALCGYDLARQVAELQPIELNMNLPPQSFRFEGRGGRYVQVNFETGEVESNVPRDVQAGVIVEAMVEVLRYYGIEPKVVEK